MQELTGGLMVFSYSKGKLRKVDQTTILANGFKGTFTGADILLTENFYMPQTVGKRIRFQPLEF
jgi:6-phosphogluconolactonase (cycloisomerase 2 family)